MQHRQAILVNDARQDPRFSNCLDPHVGTRRVALMAAPLPAPKGVMGVLVVANWQTTPYTPEELRTLQAVGSTMSVALENARLYAEQQRLLREKEQAQAQLIYSKKMAALGRLAASFAHEINNPLQAIQGCLTLTHEELEGEQRPEKLTRYLGVVGAEIDRIATIVRNMRGFYRPVREGRVPTDVHAVLESVLELSRKQLQQHDIAVERHWAPELPHIQANPDHLKQVFLNLVLNAIDAMPQGGTLRISSAPAQIRQDGAQPQPAARVEFSDTGIGMSPEAQSRLFEPFFTTKEQGSGLGLSTSYGIIQAHNGQIEVESQAKVGTTFTILLPVGANP
jgi:two-component system NtrC family sensor kinase